MVDPCVPKSDKMTKRSSFGGVVRRTLSDITNSVNHEKTIMPLNHSVKEYDHLVKENMALARLVADKNKIIEITGTELHKMRLDLEKMQFNLEKMQVNFQKMQLQNLNLAQSNSHMLAELNIGRDKRKVLQHENSCKDALLKVKNEELKANIKIENHLKNLSQEGEEAVDEQISQSNAKVQKTRRGAARSKSMGPTATPSQPVVEKEVSENKRRCLRRQSARPRSQEQEPENLFEIEEAQFLAAPSVEFTPAKLSLSSSSRKVEENIENFGQNSDVFDSRRSSLGRPSRRAAEKVQSYKETPLNIKMRR